MRFYDIFMKLRDCEGKWNFSRNSRFQENLNQEFCCYLLFWQNSDCRKLNWGVKVLVDLIWHFYLFRSESIDVIGILGTSFLYRYTKIIIFQILTQTIPVGLFILIWWIIGISERKRTNFKQVETQDQVAIIKTQLCHLEVEWNWTVMWLRYNSLRSSMLGFLLGHK